MERLARLYGGGKGMKQEYDKLSDALLKNLRLALLYAINEG